MWHTYQKGEVAHLRVQLRAAEKGIVVSRPIIECRYDLVLDVGGRLYRAQVKYADWRSETGGVYLDLRKQTRNVGPRRPYLVNEIDVLLVYLPKVDAVLWLDAQVWAGKDSLTFRISPTKNKQRAHVRDYKDFIW